MYGAVVEIFPSLHFGELKVCPKCSVAKPIASFSKSSSKPDGLNYFCKECDAKKKKAYNKKNSCREVIITPNFKKCPGCKVEKPGLAFYRANREKDGLSDHCKECRAIQRREYLYGATEEWYQATLEAQGGACAICRFTPRAKDRKLCVDHKHVEGWNKMPPEERKPHLRGLLCHSCNRGIGNLRDNGGFINGAIRYLNYPTSGVTYKKGSEDIKRSILIKQNYLCEICTTDLHNKKACVDHCHLTNMVRGILCFGCNCGLGQFKDSQETLSDAIVYLLKHETVAS